ncbi:MAG: FmdB family zinc ribbon protein [Candidatus Hydrogenedentota bacterium]
MRLYQYKCTQCEKEMELLVRDGETPTCPSCGSTELQRQAGRFAALSGSASGGGDMPPSCGCGPGGCGLN